MSQAIDAYCTLGLQRETTLAPEDLLRCMDDCGIARAVVAPEDAEIAVHNSRGNRRIAQISRKYADRFVPACSINPWYGVDGVKMLCEAVADGAKMLVLAPALQGFCFGDVLADDLLTVAGELGILVYAHTGPHSQGAPTQLAIAAAAHKNVKFILGHCGSTDYTCDMPAVIHSSLENLWFELSLVRPWAAASYLKIGDRRKFIFGSSAPRNDPGYELRYFDKWLPRREYADVYGENMAELLAGVKS